MISLWKPPSAMARPTLFLIDGSSQMYRAYHAFRGRGLSNQEGHTTHAVYVFVTMLRKLIQDHAPAYLAASFDLAGPTFRDDIAADYKANRAAMPDDLREQINWVHEACEAMGVPILTSPGYEADDVIGTVARRATVAGFEVVIVSIDKDFFQLVGDHVRVYDPREDGAWFDEQGVLDKFGVVPSRVVDVLALVGDTSDNVAGVPGIGKKGAVELIGRFGSLDSLLSHAAELKPKQREALETHRADALQSQQLVTIRTEVPMDVDFEALRYRGASRERCYELFTRLAFRTLVNDYAPSADTIQKDYRLVTSIEELDALAATLRTAGEFGFRVIPDQPSAFRASIVGIAFSTADRQAHYVPLGHEGEDATGDLLAGATMPEQVSCRDGLERLRPLFEDETIRKVGHDLKFDLVVLGRHGVTLRGLTFDSMLASYLLDATRPGHPLEETSLEHLGYKALTEEDVCGRGVRAMALSRVSPAGLLNFAGERADLARQLWNRLAPLLVTDHLDRVYRELEMPLVPVLAAIEDAGVRLDGPALAAQSQHIEQELAALTSRIFELAGQEFNINSPRQLGEILFDKLQLPALKKTGKTRSASTAVEVLEELALTHELPRLILEWRGLHKLKSTYIDALPQLVDPRTGRVHTCFNQAVAATGRLSSSDPNLQNIPIRTEEGRRIRAAFVAAPGHLLLSADYSQIELRVLAALSGDRRLSDAFRADEDIHARTAAEVFADRPPAEGRRRAKVINFGIVYGMGPARAARELGVPQAQAAAYIDAYFARYQGVRAFVERTVAEARTRGFVTTVLGRRRYLPELNARDPAVRQFAERAATNTPIQGSAADLIKLAMLEVRRRLLAGGLGARMLLQVHDELLFEVPEAELGPTKDAVRGAMEQVWSLGVPLRVDLRDGANWTEAH